MANFEYKKYKQPKTISDNFPDFIFAYFRRIENELEQIDRRIKYIKTEPESTFYKECLHYDIEDLEASLRSFRDRFNEN